MNTVPKKKFLRLIIGNTLLLSSVLIVLITWTPILKDEVVYQWRRLIGQKTTLQFPSSKPQLQNNLTPFGKLLSQVIDTNPITLEPVDRNFGIVIEKIGVNAPVIKNVSVTDATAYNNALRFGVAHAEGSALPSDPRGNIYLFAHSSLNFWQLGHYATVFNLLRKLTAGDKVHIFYENKDYVYTVIDKQVVTGFDTYSLERKTIEPVLTLQTCDPPGTTINRLVITAKLVGI